MSPLTSNILIGDIDTLLCAVKARLQGSAEVLECVDALQQLHAMLAPIRRLLGRAAVSVRTA